MGALIGALVARGMSEKLARVIAYAGLAVLLLGASAGLVVAYNHHVIAVHNAKLVKKAGKANDQAASERSQDTIATSKHEQELHDAVHAQPDQPIAPTSRALSCQRLRDIGHSPPACR